MGWRERGWRLFQNSAVNSKIFGDGRGSMPAPHTRYSWSTPKRACPPRYSNELLSGKYQEMGWPGAGVLAASITVGVGERLRQYRHRVLARGGPKDLNMNVSSDSGCRAPRLICDFSSSIGSEQMIEQSATVPTDLLAWATMLTGVVSI